MLRCNACHKFEHDDYNKIIEQLNCGHNIHDSCQKKWSKLIGNNNNCILCFDGKFNSKSLKCLSCDMSFSNNKDEAYDHIQQVHTSLRCMSCEFEFLKHQEDNHMTYFCNGNRCALCMAPCVKTLKKCGHAIHPECREKWDMISSDCMICTVKNNNIPISTFVCPVRKCHTLIKYHKWESHLFDTHYKSLMTLDTIHCPFKKCKEKKIDNNNWYNHYKKNHNGHVCHLMLNCPKCTFGFKNVSTFKCPIVLCPSKDTEFNSYSYCRHFYEVHKPRSCKICGSEYLSNHSDIHDLICRYKLVYCPANGCNNIIPSKKRKLVMETADADFLIKDHDCNNCLICSSCNKSFLTINVLMEHVKTHTNDDIGIANHPYRRKRQCALESREKTKSFFNWEDGEISDNEYIERIGVYEEEEEEEEEVFENIGSDDSDDSSC